MKKNYFFKTYLFILFCFLSLTVKAQLSAGDIAFVALNTDGDDDFAIVALATITSNTTIYFTDNNWDGVSSFSTSEGTIAWDSGPVDINPGTIIVFTDVDSDGNANYGVSIGSITTPDAGFNLSGGTGGDTLLAYIGTLGSPTAFLTGIKNAELTAGELDNTGLTSEVNFMKFSPTASPDGGYYSGSRSNQASYSSYLTFLVADDEDANYSWTHDTTNGENILPISQEAFTTNTTNWTGGTSSVWSLAGNWDNGIPTSSSLATIPDVTTSPIISSGTEAEVGNLTINSGETLTINSANALTVSGVLTITGDLTMNSSSSLIVRGTSTGNLTYNRTLGTTNWYLISSPVSGQDIDAFASAEGLAVGTLDNRGLGDYNNTTPGWEYYQNGASGTGNFTLGDGRAIKLAATGDIAFTGSVSTSAVGIAITSNTNAFNLIGNPFLSSIPANTNADATNNILTINSSSLSETTLWFWDQSANAGAGGYEQINQASSSMFIDPSQGFFVSSSGSHTFNFTEAMQSHQSSDSFQRNNATSTRPEIILSLTDGTAVKEADIYYIDGTSTGFDNGYDSSIFGGVSNDFVIYTHAVANGNGRNLGIQSLPDSNFENMIIPVGVHATSGTEITISANAVNLPTGINVYLEDKDNNTFTLLDGSSDFTTTLSSDLNGIGRFYIHTSSQALSLDEVNLDNISMYTSSANNLRIVGVQNRNADVKIYNILGSQVLRSSFQGNGVNDITLPNLKTGVYIIQLKTEAGKLNKKVIIE